MSTNKGKIRVGGFAWVDDLNPNVTQRRRSVAVIVESISGKLAMVKSGSVIWCEPVAALRPFSNDAHAQTEA